MWTLEIRRQNSAWSLFFSNSNSERAFRGINLQQLPPIFCFQKAAESPSPELHTRMIWTKCYIYEEHWSPACTVSSALISDGGGGEITCWSWSSDGELWSGAGSGKGFWCTAGGSNGVAAAAAAAQPAALVVMENQIYEDKVQIWRVQEEIWAPASVNQSEKWIC